MWRQTKPRGGGYVRNLKKWAHNNDIWRKPGRVGGKTAESAKAKNSKKKTGLIRRRVQNGKGPKVLQTDKGEKTGRRKKKGKPRSQKMIQELPQGEKKSQRRAVASNRKGKGTGELKSSSWSHGGGPFPKADSTSKKGGEKKNLWLGGPVGSAKT